MLNTFQVRLQAQVLDILAEQPLTIGEASDKLRTNYHSTRNAIRYLERDGRVKAVNYGVHRNVRYTLGRSIVTGQGSIPVFKGAKLNEWLKFRVPSPEKSLTVQAVMRFPYYVTRIMDCAQRFNSGDTTATLSLTTVREQMERDLKKLEQMVDYYKNVLNEPSNWSGAQLALYLKDEAWDETWLTDAKQIYEREDHGEAQE